MVKPDEITQIVNAATTAMRAKGVRRLKIDGLEIDLAEEEPAGAQPDPGGEDPPAEEDVEPSGNVYEHPDLYGGPVVSLRRTQR